MKTLSRLVLAISALLVTVGTVDVVNVASAESAPDGGTALEPKPASQPIYAGRGIAPWENREKQESWVESGDTDIFVETWLPAAKPGGPQPPERVPTIVWPSPYSVRDTDNAETTRPYFNSRGYAVTFVHLRGTGASGGCFDMGGSVTVNDLELVLDELSRAPWFDGTIGMYGKSYEANAIMALASLGDSDSMKHLKAIVPVNGNGGMYDAVGWDGVQRAPGFATGLLTYYNVIGPFPFSWTMDRAHIPERAECKAEHALAGLEFDVTGDKSAFWMEREYRLDAKNVRAATFLVHGFASGERDTGDWFSLLPATTPKHMMTGLWEGVHPHFGDGGAYQRSVRPEWARTDFMDWVVAWFDQHLKGLDAGTDTWPVVQVQDSTGQWRTAAGWPNAGGPVGHLALGTGTLGALDPIGSSGYVEPYLPGAEGEAAGASFTSPPLRDRLHVTGRPVLDAWLRLNQDDAHVAARLEVLRPDGTPEPYLVTVATRSARHLGALVDGVFVQAAGEPAPTDTDLLVSLRFDPVDWVVPVGSRLRLTVGGTTRAEWDPIPAVDPIADPPGAVVAAYGEHSGYTVPSGRGTVVEILHDCARRTSVLRFQLPASGETYVNVREHDDPAGPLLSNNTRPPKSEDGAGIATRSICRPKIGVTG